MGSEIKINENAYCGVLDTISFNLSSIETVFNSSAISKTSLNCIREYQEIMRELYRVVEKYKQMGTQSKEKLIQVGEQLIQADIALVQSMEVNYDGTSGYAYETTNYKVKR